MATFTLEESDFAGYLPTDTIVQARVVKVKLDEKKFTDDDGNPVVKVVFKFKIDEPDGEYSEWDGVDVYGETSTKFVDHPDCKLRSWSQAILCQEFPKGFKLETDILEGEACRVILELNEWVDKKTNEPRQNNRVMGVMPARGQTVTALDSEEPF